MSALPVAAGADRLPVSLLTGFLGSGKTTLLNRLLRHPAMARTAVVINEFGEIALDQHFVEKTHGETVVLANGCLCCSVQGDMESVIGTLFARRAQGAVPGFDRMLIETSGLADPAPIMQMLLGQPLVVDNFRLDTVIATVDAWHGERQLREHEEAFKQAALADRLVITKTDLAGDEQASALERHLQSINPGATRCRSQHASDPQQLFGAGRLDTPQGLAHWLPACDTTDTSAGAHDAHRHSEGVASVCLTAERPLRWSALNRWLTDLRIRHADRLLRVKGIVRLEGERVPVAIHGVHHVFHPPEPLPHLAGGADGGGSRLVLVTRDLPRDEVQSSWGAFLEASGPPGRSRP